jgi:hypothetical protein
MRSKFALATILTMLGSASGAHAQGCALCYTTAANLGASGQHALDLGILALLTPAVLIFLGVMFMLYRRSASTVE